MKTKRNVGYYPQLNMIFLYDDKPKIYKNNNVKFYIKIGTIYV